MSTDAGDAFADMIIRMGREIDGNFYVISAMK